MFTPATVTGGTIKIWRKKYNALVDCTESVGVNGQAYHVRTEGQEDALRLHETENYEIVRCAINMGATSDPVMGLAFKFVGPSEDLT